jgi:hypothetical protein
MKLTLQTLFGLMALNTISLAQTGTDPGGAPPSAPQDTLTKPFSKPFLVPDGVDIDRLKDAAQAGATSVWRDFVSTVDAGTVKSFAVLPLQKDLDGNYVALQLRNKFTEICGPQGFQLYTRMDEDWNTLLREIAWGENYGDTMDSATVQKFGRIKGVQAVVFSQITGASRTETGGVKLRLNVQAFEVETGRQLWGKEIVTIQEGTFAPVMIVSTWRDYWQWYLLVGGAVVGLILLVFLMRYVARASRPR